MLDLSHIVLPIHRQRINKHDIAARRFIDMRYQTLLNCIFRQVDWMFDRFRQARIKVVLWVLKHNMGAQGPGPTFLRGPQFVESGNKWTIVCMQLVTSSKCSIVEILNCFSVNVCYT